MVSYNPLWKMLIDRKMSKADFRRETGISSNTLTRMNKGEAVSFALLNKICAHFQCDYSDIIEYDPTAKPKDEEN